MTIKAVSKYLRMTPKKVRLVADSVRHLKPQEAVIALKLLRKRAAGAIEETLKSAIANAVNNHKIKAENLRLVHLDVDEGPAFKRWRAVSRGQAHAFKKRTSHITVILEGEAEKVIAEKTVAKVKKPTVKEAKKDGTKS